MMCSACAHCAVIRSPRPGHKNQGIASQKLIANICKRCNHDSWYFIIVKYWIVCFFHAQWPHFSPWKTGRVQAFGAQAAKAAKASRERRRRFASAKGMSKQNQYRTYLRLTERSIFKSFHKMQSNHIASNHAKSPCLNESLTQPT